MSVKFSDFNAARVTANVPLRRRRVWFLSLALDVGISYLSATEERTPV